MINAKPRFGLEGERLFDYETSRYLDPVECYEVEHGYWNLVKVAECLHADKSIESAFTSHEAAHQLDALKASQQKQVHALNAENTAQNNKIQALELKLAEYQKVVVGGPDTMGRKAPEDKVQKANADFVAGTPPNPPNDKVEQANRDFMSDPLPNVPVPEAPVDAQSGDVPAAEKPSA